MNASRYLSIGRLGLAAMLAIGLAGCGGGGGGTSGSGSSETLAATISAAAAVTGNDTAGNPHAAFSVLQSWGLPMAQSASPLKIRFTVFSDGAVKTGLTTANLSVAIAKLVPGTNGDPDQWVNYIYKTESTASSPNNVGPGGTPALASALQATTDPKDKNGLGTLEYNADDGYYTYTFSTDIRDPAFNANSVKTNGVVFEPTRTHRVALQLSYTNAAGATVKVNPYYDFRFVPYTTGCENVNGCYESVALTDPATQTRVMANVDNCNTCHNQLALHGGGRVDVQYCVMCHNPGTTDANSGNALTLATMAHKIHAGRALGANALQIWGYGSTEHNYDEVGFPQDLRNCNKCHTASSATPQGDNWKSHPSREACLTCHIAADTATAKLRLSDWTTRHDALALSLSPAKANAAAMTNADCASCHTSGQWGAEQVHWNQNEENAAKYKVNIDSATFLDTSDHTGRKIRVVYYVSDPTNGDAAYNLNADCSGAAGANGLATCTSSNKFGNLRLYLAYKNLVGANPNGATDWSNSGGTNVYGYTGTKDGSNHYTVDISLPNDTATAVAQGTLRVISVGQVKEAQLDVVTRAAVSPTVLVNVSQQNTYKDVALSGTLAPRRTVVSDAYCNKCHGTLGTTSGSNTLSTAFHSGARNSTIACVMCHDANKMSSTVMADGSGYNESYQAKRMIHGIHGGAKRTFPFTHGNTNSGPWNKDGTLVADGTTTFASGVENYSKEVAYPGILSDCTTCHVTDSVTGLGSYQNDQGPLGAVISKKDANPLTGTTTTDPGLWKIISPKAASCTACHDSTQARDHVSNQTVVNTGGMYGMPSPVTPGSGTTVAATQANFLAGALVENCNECHGPGQIYDVKKVHSGLANPTNTP